MAIIDGIKRGIIGFITAAILGGLCVVFGIDPKLWVAAVLTNPPGWISSPWVQIAAFLVGGAAGLVAWKLWPWRSPRVAENTGQIYPPADLDEWRKVDPLELWRAGCLWKGFQPHDTIAFNDPAYASYIMLVNAAKGGQLTVKNPGTEVDAWSLVSRAELARFAQSKGEMPDFLVDESDESAASLPGGVRIDHVENLYLSETGEIKKAELQIQENQPSIPNIPMAYVRFKPSEMFEKKTGVSSLGASYNITSITDNGTGDFSFTFGTPLDKDTLIGHPIGTTPQFTIVDARPNSANVKFEGPEPDEIAIRFDSLPDTSLREVKRDVWLLDAMYYIGFRTWEPIEWDDLQGESIKLLGVEEDVRQRALDGDLPIWGREGFSGPLKLLPKDYWEYYGFDWFSLLNGDPKEYKTERKARVSRSSIRVCRSLKSSKAKIEELWPAANT